MTVTLRVAEDAPPRNHSVTVKVNGMSSNSKNFFVQIPKALQRVDFFQGAIPSQQSKGIGPLILITDDSVKGLDGQVINGATHKCGAYRHFLYQLVDQASTPRPVMEEVTVIETFPQNEKTGDDIPSRIGPAQTTAEGFLQDINALIAPAGLIVTCSEPVCGTAV